MPDDATRMNWIFHRAPLSGNRSTRRFSDSSTLDERWNVPLAMSERNDFYGASGGAVKNQVVAHGPKQEGSITGQIFSSMAHSGSRRQRKNLVLKDTDKAICGIQVILSNVFPNVVEIGCCFW